MSKLVGTSFLAVDAIASAVTLLDAQQASHLIVLSLIASVAIATLGTLCRRAITPHSFWDEPDGPSPAANEFTNPIVQVRRR